MENAASHPHSFEERLSRLEATVETFVLTVSKDIQDQNSNINALRKAIQEQIKTPWPNYIAGAGVLALVLGMFGSIYLRDLNRLDADVVNLRVWRNQHDTMQAATAAAHTERLIALEREQFGDGRVYRSGGIPMIQQTP